MQTCSQTNTCAPSLPIVPHSFSFFFKSLLHSQLRPYLHSDACSCVIHLRCRLIFQSPGSATVSKRSRMSWREEEEEGCSRLSLGKACQPAQVAFCLDSPQGAREHREGKRKRGEEGSTRMYSIWISIYLFNSVIHYLILCNWFNVLMWKP